MTSPIRRVAHLVRRWRGSLDRSPIPDHDIDLARRVLLPQEWELWSTMAIADRRHSIAVARRFSALARDADDAAIAAALLHDVGKVASSLSTFERVLATLIAPIAKPRRWNEYYRHEAIGIDMCRSLPSRPRTMAVLTDPDDPLHEVLRRADDI